MGRQVTSVAVHERDREVGVELLHSLDQALDLVIGRSSQRDPETLGPEPADGDGDEVAVQVPDEARGPLSAEHLPDHGSLFRSSSAAASRRRGSQRVAQFASLAGATAQVVIQRRALHTARKAARNDEHATRILAEQERAIHRQARLSWAPAHDPHWLAHADLLQTGRAWAGAAACADTDPAAASAMRKCEGRLRTLHPYARPATTGSGKMA